MLQKCKDADTKIENSCRCWTEESMNEEGYKIQLRTRYKSKQGNNSMV